METNSWLSTLVSDNGWNRPYIDDESLIPKRYNTLRTHIIEKNLVCASNGNVYIYLPVQNKWSILCSDEATIFLNAVMEMENATVQYDKAFRPYVSYLERNASENLATKIPTSICIGTTRTRINRNGNGLTLSVCEPVLIHNPSYGKHHEVSALCYMPLSIKQWPKRWERTNNFPMYQFISPLFPDGRELLTIEWVLGNALVDPNSFSKAVILYGQGGTGKSTLLALIKIAFMGCCGSIPDKSLIGLAKGMSTDVASIVVSNRIVTAGDVGGIEDSTNLSVIKSLTGHDYISIPPLSARSSCSLFYATNRLDDPRKNTEWLTAQIMRRVVVVPMTTDALGFTENTIPQDQNSRLDFALRCVHTFLSHPHMPVSSMSIVLTLLGSASNDIMQYITEDDDEEILEEEYFSVLGILASAASIEASSIGDLVRKMSPSAVKTIRTTYCIVGLRPTVAYYESTGQPIPE